MEIKPKPCKGNGKAIGYGCGTLQLKRKYGLGYKCGCFRDWLLNSAEGNETLKKTQISASVKVKKDKAKQTREWKEEHKSIAKLIQEARIPFQKWIRMRDANQGCISCGTINSAIYHGGHFMKAELYTGLIFDERNCWKQCNKCNVFLNGNEGEYRKRLIEKFGQDWINKLDEDANRLRTYKFTREELNDIKKKYQSMI